MKTICGLGLLICFTALSCKPKTPDRGVQIKGEILWEKSYGENNGASFETMIATPDGGYLLGGRSSAGKSVDKSEQNYGIDDYWVVKIDNEGSKLWDRTFGGSHIDQLTCLALTADGGYLIGGKSRSGPNGNKTTGNIGQLDFDFWIIKVNAAGQTQWEKVFGNRGNDILQAILPIAGGGYLLTGHTQLPETGATNGGSDFWVVRIDEQGLKMWDKCYGGSEWELLYTAVTTADGCFLLGGNSASGISGNKTTNSRGDSDFWIVKIRPDGDIVWDRTYGGSESETVTGIVNTPDNGYLLTGVTDTQGNSKGDLTSPSAGLMDYWIVRTDDLGNKLWDRTIGDAGQNVLDCPPVAYNGGLLTGGYHYMPPKEVGVYVPYQYTLTNFDASGKVLWDRPVSPNTLKSIIPSGQNGRYLIGGSGSPLNEGSKRYRYWVALIR